VMANSAGDARGSELEIRKKLIQSGAVDVVVSVGPNMFYTVTLPCTLWFFDKGKPKKRRDQVLFVDARPYFKQVSRALREYTDDHLEFLANVVRLYRGEKPEFEAGSQTLTEERFPKLAYVDVAGLCKAATLAEIESKGWTLNPGRYVGVGERALDDTDFQERLAVLNEELELLNGEAAALQELISTNVGVLAELTT